MDAADGGSAGNDFTLDGVLLKTLHKVNSPRFQTYDSAAATHKDNRCCAAAQSGSRADRGNGAYISRDGVKCESIRGEALVKCAKAKITRRD
jgi:hypothetical protein